MRKGFKYQIQHLDYVQNTKTGDFITKFVIGEKIKDTDKYENWRCTVFEDIDLKNDETIVIDEILSITAREYRDKLYFDCILRIHRLGEMPERFNPIGD